METAIFRKEQLEKKEWQSLQEYLLGYIKPTGDKLLRVHIA